MGRNSLSRKRDAWIFIGIVFFSLILFQAAVWYGKYLYRIYNPGLYLTWHTLLELLSVNMAFAIFAITFYTFEESNHLKPIVTACVFIAVGFLDVFHFLSYKGMPFFNSEFSAVRATTYWVYARMTMAVGMLAASIIPAKKKTRCHRIVFLMGAMSIVILLLILVQYHLDELPPFYVEDVGLTPLKVYMEYIIIGLQIATMGLVFRKYKREPEDGGYFLIIIALLISVFSEMAFTLYSSPYDTYNLLGHIYKIIAYYLLFRAFFVINVQKPYKHLREADQKLSAYADNLEKIIEQRTFEVTEAKSKLEKDLDYARIIQMAILPMDFPKMGSMSFAARYLPCEKVGGDFYNIFKLDDDNVGILLGDVAGHGVSAAMINVFINQSINTKKEYEDGHYKIFTPRGVLANLYHVYNGMSFPEEAYVVMFYGIYNIRTRELLYASAGMNASPLILSSEGKVVPLEMDGFPICQFGKHFKPSYKTKSVQLEEGDTLILYTDGLMEIDRNRPEIFANENLIEFITGIKDESAQNICDQLIDAYFALLGEQKMLDDVTVLVVKTSDDSV